MGADSTPTQNTAPFRAMVALILTSPLNPAGGVHVKATVCLSNFSSCFLWVTALPGSPQLRSCAKGSLGFRVNLPMGLSPARACARSPRILLAGPLPLITTSKGVPAFAVCVLVVILYGGGVDWGGTGCFGTMSSQTLSGAPVEYALAATTKDTARTTYDANMLTVSYFICFKSRAACFG
ncbi:unnamed protein product [Spodoptera exigua]|nr:unnamed protein product [Spodoptera exigua]